MQKLYVFLMFWLIVVAAGNYIGVLYTFSPAMQKFYVFLMFWLIVVGW